MIKKVLFIICFIILDTESTYGAYNHLSKDDFSKVLGKTIIVGFEGLTPEDMDVQETREMMQKKLIAGVILFKHNIKSPEQVQKLIAYLKKDYADAIISIDQEGGKIARFDVSNGNAHIMPSAKSYKNSDEVYRYFLRTGEILKELGFNLDFAPVLDIHNTNAPAIGGLERSFSHDEKIVTEYGLAAINGLKDGGVLSCGKHFPGHGNARQDTHLAFADITSHWDEAKELYPFLQLKKYLPFMMVGHIFNRNIDQEFPASISKKTYDLLGQYNGRFVTDDYYMAAIAGQYTESEFIVKAINAGSSLMIFGQHPKMLKILNREKIPVKKFVIQMHDLVYNFYRKGELDERSLNAIKQLKPVNTIGKNL